MGILHFGDFRACYATTTACFSMKKQYEYYSLGMFLAVLVAVYMAGLARPTILHLCEAPADRGPVCMDQQKNGGAQAADTHADIRFLSRSSCCYQPTTKRQAKGNMRPSNFKRTPLDNIKLKHTNCALLRKRRPITRCCPSARMRGLAGCMRFQGPCARPRPPMLFVCFLFLRPRLV